jgi:glycosyltransferase involved in cell wall biosynthesis
VEAFSRVAAAVSRSRLLIVGDGELRNQLETLAQSSGAQDRVIFAGFRDDLPALYSAFDIYAHSSVEGGGETFPFAVLQALAQELPAVVTRVGDVAEMIAEGENGFVVPDRDAAAMAGPLQKLCEDAGLRSQMAANSRKRLLDNFTTGKMVDKVEDVYAQSLGG